MELTCVGVNPSLFPSKTVNDLLCQLYVCFWRGEKTSSIIHSNKIIDSIRNNRKLRAPPPKWVSVCISPQGMTIIYQTFESHESCAPGTSTSKTPGHTKHLQTINVGPVRPLGKGHGPREWGNHRWPTKILDDRKPKHRGIEGERDLLSVACYDSRRVWVRVCVPNTPFYSY